jgi:hypothetical protein
MATIDLGDAVPLSVQVRDANGALANAGAITLTVTLPDGTSTVVSTANPTTGNYSAAFSTSMPGRHVVAWVATGANACAFYDAFTVIDPAEMGLVGLDDVKRHLNITATTSDEELRAVLMAATSAAEDYLRRPLRRLALTETFYTRNGNGRGLVLSRTDLSEITEIVEDGVTLTSDDFAADLNAGVVWREDCREWCYPATVEFVTFGVDSPALRQAVLELTRHLWETQRGSMPMMPRGADGMEMFNPAMSYSLPRRVTELLAPYRMPL